MKAELGDYLAYLTVKGRNELTVFDSIWIKEVQIYGVKEALVKVEIGVEVKGETNIQFSLD